MRTYRLELILNERDLIEFLDQNPGYKPTVEGIASSDTSATQDTPEPYHPIVRRGRARRKRNVEPTQAAAE